MLGTAAEDAAGRAEELLSSPHPAVAAAAAVWDRARFCDPERFGPWADGLPTVVERGPVPDQAGADSWADRATGGLVGSFPADLDDPDVAVVLASALATRIRWAEPFEDADAAELGGPFAAAVSTALRTPPGTGFHRCFLADSEAAGTVGVHAAVSGDGLEVASVIAAAEVAPDRVHRAAGEVAALLGGFEGGAQRRSLFDCPLGEGPAWVVAEHERPGSAPDGRTESHEALLVAWRASSRHDLAGDAGVGDAFAALEALLLPTARPAAFEAVQVAVAAYGREGFEAAAVTGLAMAGSAMPSGTVRHRHATIRFNRPHAVMAVARADAFDLEQGRGRRAVAPPCWEGMPAFSAWVEHPGG